MLPVQLQTALDVPESHWLSADDFASLAEISDRKARLALARAVEGKTWRRQSLTVRVVRGSGGKAGEVYEVLATSLPADLVQAWIHRNTEHPMPAAPVARTVDPDPSELALDPLWAERSAKARRRHAIIEPLLQYPRGTPGRGTVARELAKQHGVGVSALYEWVRGFEKDGWRGLVPCQRADKGRPRTLITRAWDAACPLDGATKKKVADQLRRHIRSLWAEGTPGWTAVQQLASSRLVELSRDAGWHGSDTVMRKACLVSRPVVEAEREYRLVAIRDKDAKRYHDEIIPRISRHRDGMLPMDVVIGDVHPIDIYVMREDGTLACPRGIAWQDAATNRVFVDPVLLPPRQGIRQVDIAESFARMCSEWGLPKRLYLDNGSEYSWQSMMDGFQNLANLASIDVETGRPPAGSGQKVSRAQPYNAQAKPIEGLFGLLERRVFPMIPGWVGGNRMKKKTHNVGQEPKPYPGTWEQFKQDLISAIDFYHQTPQSGSLKGRSPKEAYEAAIAKGWGKTAIARDVLLVAFAEKDKRKIDRGYLSWNGRQYYHDALLPLTGQVLTVGVAKHFPSLAFVFRDDNTPICTAELAKAYPFVGSEGAVEKARRRKLVNGHVSNLRRGAPKLDLVEEMRSHNASLPPMPDAPTHKEVGLSEPWMKVVQEMRANDERLLEASRKPKAAGVATKPLQQWSSPNEYDPYLEGIDFSDDE